MLHKTRELPVKQRTMSVNALRSHLAEFGLVVAKGVGRVDELIELADNDPSLPQEAREMAKLLALHVEGLDRSIAATGAKIAQASRSSKTSRLIDGVPASAR